MGVGEKKKFEQRGLVSQTTQRKGRETLKGIRRGKSSEEGIGDGKRPLAGRTMLKRATPVVCGLPSVCQPPLVPREKQVGSARKTKGGTLGQEPAPNRPARASHIIKTARESSARDAERSSKKKRLRRKSQKRKGTGRDDTRARSSCTGRAWKAKIAHSERGLPRTKAKKREK